MSQHEKDMGLLPIMNPLFNLREICKQMVLLEDHLNNPRKRCPDCISKHFITIEAFFEEAISLDKDLKYSKLLDGKAQIMRDLQGLWLKFKDTDKEDRGYALVAQFLRRLRKDILPMSFDVRKMACLSVSCPHRKRVATLTQTEKEEREVQSLIKTSPKKKPPRKDKMRRRIEVEDKDLGGNKTDPDLKKASLIQRVVDRYLSH